MPKSTNGSQALLDPVSVTEAVERVDQPVIDFSELSWGDTKRIPALGDRFNQEQAKGTAADANVLNALLLELIGMIAPLVVSVPRAWLVRRAPDDLDFGQPDALNWLRKDRVMDLINAVATGAGQPADEAANLPKP